MFLLNKTTIMLILTCLSITSAKSQVVITSKFKPMTYEEMAQPLREASYAYNRAQNSFDENLLKATQEITSSIANYAMAGMYYKRCIDLNSRYNNNLYSDIGGLLYNYAICCYNTNDPNKASLYFAKAGMVYSSETNYDKAIECLTNSLNIRYNGVVMFFRARAYDAINDNYKSSIDYNTIIAKGCSDSEILAMTYNNLAYYHTCNSHYNRALDLVNKALNLSVGISFIWDTRGEIYYHIGKFNECIIDMDRAISIKSGETSYGNSYYYRGLAKLKLGKTRSAKSDLKKSAKCGKTEAYHTLNTL